MARRHSRIDSVLAVVSDIATAVVDSDVAVVAAVVVNVVVVFRTFAITVFDDYYT